MILIIDNYDSFTFNLVQRLGEIDSSLEIQVVRNDKISVEQIESLDPSHVIISPGPCTPKDAGISVEVAQKMHGKVPLLGVCLGHQSIGQAGGGKIVRAKTLMHGKTDAIHHNRKTIFSGLPNPMTATRYHSLIIDPDSLPDGYSINAWTENPDGSTTIMGIEHATHPTFGVQFHPESFLTEAGIDLLGNFLRVS